MSCSAPGTHGPPEMKTVRNSVLLRLSLALFFRLPQGDLRTFAALPQQTHARSPRDHQLASTPPARAAQEPWTRNPESCPHGLSGEGASGRKAAARGPVLPPRPPQSARPLPTWPKPPPPALVLLASSAPTEEWGATASCFLATQHTSGQGCTNHFAGKIVMFMEHLRGWGFTGKQFHCVDGRERGKP